MAQPIDRDTETREQWLGRAIEMMRPEFADAGAPLPESLAVSCSWPSGNPRTVIGECWVAEASSRGYVEVFIRFGGGWGRCHCPCSIRRLSRDWEGDQLTTRPFLSGKRERR
jgi:hypothetical protein